MIQTNDSRDLFFWERGTKRAVELVALGSGWLGLAGFPALDVGGLNSNAPGEVLSLHALGASGLLHGEAEVHGRLFGNWESVILFRFNLLALDVGAHVCLSDLAHAPLSRGLFASGPAVGIDLGPGIAWEM